MTAHDRVTISTTETLEGRAITAYLGVLSAHIAARTHLFKEMLSIFSDAYGGHSRAHQQELAGLTDEALSDLADQADGLGADAVVGTRIEHIVVTDHRGRSMLMVTATGTAVRTENGTATQAPDAPLTAAALETLHRRQRLIQAFAEGGYRPDEEAWTFIARQRVEEVLPQVAGLLRETAPLGGTFGTQRPFIKAYLASLPDEPLKDTLYDLAVDPQEALRTLAREVLRERTLFDAERILRLLDDTDFDRRKHALALCLLPKAVYTPDDYPLYRALREKVQQTFAPRSHRKTLFKTFSSDTKEVWECKCGYQNEAALTHCARCGRNAYGFLRSETDPDAVSEQLTDLLNLLETQFVIRDT